MQEQLNGRFANDFRIYRQGSSNDALVIGTNDAATFSSSVTAGGKIFTSASVADNIIEVINSDTTNGYGLYVRAGGTASGRYVARFKNGADSDVMWIGNTGNVGIGTSSPSSWTSLQVNGTAGAQTDAKQQLNIAAPTTTVGEGAGIRLNAASGAKEAVAILGVVNEASGNLGAMTFHTYAGGGDIPERMRITSGGEVGIGVTPTSGNRFWVKGVDSTSSNTSIYIQNSSSTVLMYIRNDGAFFTGTASSSPYNNTSGGTANLIVTSAGSLERATSSLKYKKNVEDYTKGLTEVMQLRPVTYESKNPREEGVTFAGLIAEEVHELGLTEFVQYAEDGTPDALAYSNMIALLTKAIQELSKKVTELEKLVATK